MASLLSYALTNLSDVKESLGIPSSDTSKDNLIIRSINKATLAIENYTGRRFKKTTYTNEVYNGTGVNQIVLRQRPLIVDGDNPFTISSRTTPLNENSFETLDTERYFRDDDSGVINLTYSAINGWGTITVTYTAGYDTIPEDLAEACVDLACYYVNNAGAGEIGVLEKQEGQRRVRYGNSQNTFYSICQNLGIDQIIDSYANNPLNPNV